MTPLRNGASGAAINAGLVLALVIAFYVGARMPGLWSINYYIPAIFDGFWRRSLLGTLLYPAGVLRFDYHFIAAIQAVVLLVLAGLLLAHALRWDLRVKILTILFLVAPTGGYLFHEIGYVEQVLYLMLLAAFAADSAAIALLLLVASLFVHEMAAVTIVPLYLARLLDRGRYSMAVGHGLMLLAAFVAIYLFLQLPSPAAVDRLMAEIKTHGGYALRTDYYDVFRHGLTGPAPQNYYAIQSWYHLTTAISIAVLTASAFIRRERLAPSLATAACVLGAALAPLLMGFVAWDASRFIFLSFCASFLVLVRFEGAASTPVAMPVSLLLLAFTLFGYLVYFDDYQPRPLLPYPHLLHFFTEELPSLVGTMPMQ